jgi:hypothetical protein
MFANAGLCEQAVDAYVKVGINFNGYRLFVIEISVNV